MTGAGSTAMPENRIEPPINSDECRPGRPHNYDHLPLGGEQEYCLYCDKPRPSRDSRDESNVRSPTSGATPRTDEIASSTPCERCGRPACWLCGDDPYRTKTLCDDCYARTRHQWFIARCLDCTPLLDQPF